MSTVSFKYHYFLKIALVFLCVCIGLSIVYALINYLPNYSLHLHQADAFGHGTLSITEQAAEQALQVDIAKYQNQLFVPNPPLPGLLLTPIVYVLGTAATNLIIISFLLGIAGCIFLWRACQSIGLNNLNTAWICATFFLGTGYWSLVLAAHETAYFSQIVATICLLGGISELFSKKRSWVIGLCIACAFLSRQFTIITGSLLILELLRQEPTLTRSRQLRKLLLTGSPIVIAILLYLSFNYLRFDNPFDTGYGRIHYYGWLEERIAARGVFSYSYIRSNLYLYLIQPPVINWAHLNNVWQLDPLDFGTSLTFASPFLIFAFAEKRQKDWSFFIWWGIIVAVFVVELTYHDNGWRQVNTHRYALDYIPLMFIPLMKFIKSVQESEGLMMRLWRISSSYAIALNVVFLVFVRLFNSVIKLR